MAGSSNAFVCVANFFALLLAVPIVAGGFYLKKESMGGCSGDFPLIIRGFGVALLILAFLGIFGSCCRLNFFLCIYLFFMFLLIIGVALHVSLSFILARKSDVDSEFKLDSSSSRVQKLIIKRWADTEKCFKEKNFCSSEVLRELDENRNSANSFDNTHAFTRLHRAEIGCCQPPSECGFTRVNASNWEAPKTGIKSANNDCKTWSNNEDGMCYGCEACKAGLIATTRLGLRASAILNSFCLVYLLIIFSVGCCAFKSNKARKHQQSL